MKKLIDSKVALGCLALVSALVVACSADADIARVQGNQSGVDGGSSGTTSSGSTSSSSTSSSTSSSSSGGADSGPDANPDANMVCNGTALEGPGTTVMYKHMPAPVPAGGTIADGVYVITHDTVYDDFQLVFSYDTPMLANQRWTMEVQGGMVRRNVSGHHHNIQLSPGSGPSKIASTVVCDDQTAGGPFPPVESDYTATPTTFTEFTYSQGGGGNPIVEVYTWTKIR